MKGTSFQKPLELSLRIEGETWKQGDPICGALRIKNRGTDAVSLADVGVQLALGELKKVRAKSAGAFKTLAVFSPQAANLPQALAPEQETEFSWKFETDRNCQITDSTASLFVLYGKKADAAGSASTEIPSLASLQLVVHPYETIQDFLRTVTTTFRFVIKAQKSRKGWVEVKLAPPDSKAFSSLELLVLSFLFEGDDLNVSYVFHVKKVEALAGAVTTKKDTRETEQRFSAAQYRLASGRFNFEEIEARIQEALALVEAKVTF